MSPKAQVQPCVEVADEGAAREREARARAEAAALARDQFLTIVSHKLRSPLNGIKSWTHVLENELHETGDPMLRRAIEGIMLGVEEQVRLIEGLGREVAGLFPITREEMEMAERDKNRTPPSDEDQRRTHDAEHRERPQPDTLEGPGGRHESKDEEEARNNTTRRGER